MGQLFKDKIVVVTGAASGIGLRVAQSFAEEGAIVCGVDINGKALKLAFSKSKFLPARSSTYNADLGSHIEAENVAKIVLAEHGTIDILINNAGINMNKTIESLEIDEWDNVFNVNLRSMYILAKQFWPVFMAKKSGVIINMSSIMGFAGGVGAPAYCATKSAIDTFTRCLAKDGARSGIRVNAICPGYIDTPIMDAAHAEGADPVAARQALIDIQPMGRLGTPEDIANGALFLASESASFINGHCLVIDGAVTATQID